MSEALLISVGKGIASFRVKKKEIKNGTKLVIFVEYFLTLTADVNQRDF